MVESIYIPNRDDHSRNNACIPAHVFIVTLYSVPHHSTLSLCRGLPTEPQLSALITLGESPIFFNPAMIACVNPSLPYSLTSGKLKIVATTSSTGKCKVLTYPPKVSVWIVRQALAVSQHAHYSKTRLLFTISWH
jgi:hypothetical protein